MDHFKTIKCCAKRNKKKVIQVLIQTKSLDRDSNAVQANNLTTDRRISIAYDELQPTMFQYPRNSCQANDVKVKRRKSRE